MRYVVIPYTKMPCEIVKPPSKPCLDSQIGRQRLISLLFLLRARRVTRGKRTSTIRISPLLPQSGPNACGQRNETGSPETTSKTLSIATSHQPRLNVSLRQEARERRIVADVKPFIGTQRVTNPVRQSRASSRKRVLRGGG